MASGRPGRSRQSRQQPCTDASCCTGEKALSLSVAPSMTLTLGPTLQPSFSPSAVQPLTELTPGGRLWARLRDQRSIRHSPLCPCGRSSQAGGGCPRAIPFSLYRCDWNKQCNQNRPSSVGYLSTGVPISTLGHKQVPRTLAAALSVGAVGR